MRGRSLIAGISIATVVATIVVIGLINREPKARRLLGTEDTLRT